MISCRGGYCNGEGLVDYGKRKWIGAGHRRGGAGRGRERRNRSASDGGTGTSGDAVRRASEARYAGSRYLSARHGTGQTIRTLEGHANLVRAVAVTPDSGRAVSASGLRGR